MPIEISPDFHNKTCVSLAKKRGPWPCITCAKDVLWQERAARVKNIQEAEVDRTWPAKGSHRMTFPQRTGSEEEAAERENRGTGISTGQEPKKSPDSGGLDADFWEDDPEDI